MSKTYDIDSFTGWVAEVINASKDPFVRSAQEMVNHFFELEHAMPSIYTWRYMDAESFRSRIAEYKADVKNSINLYWLDVARSLEAYGVMMMFRTK